ncbi:condensation domain-containing protein, partial [Pseudoalteromonas sp. NJ631]|uniref:condensation domain-containing protein n=1 Tax=Pseudoalteromonas sp. NJ631 TaxID=493915 RepID=UPI000567C7E9
MKKLLNHLYDIGIKLTTEDSVNLKIVGKKEKLTPELITKIKQDKDKIIEWLRKNNSQPEVNITKVDHPNGLCLTSYSQQRLWFIDKLQGGSAEYNMPLAFKVAGQLDLDIVQAVFHTILARHEILRTVYVADGGDTLQHIRSIDECVFSVEVEDLTHLTGEMLESQVKMIVKDNVNIAFNLAEDVMLRVKYIKTSVDTGVMVLNMHHIASDGWS